MKRQWKWTSFQIDKLEKIKQILEDLKDYYPLTLRQIYYQMVGKGFIPNKRSEYQMLSDCLSNARYDNLISWDVMEDRQRRYSDLTGYNNFQSFINTTLKQWLNFYITGISYKDKNHILRYGQKKNFLTDNFSFDSHYYFKCDNICDSGPKRTECGGVSK